MRPTPFLTRSLSILSHRHSAFSFSFKALLSDTLSGIMPSIMPSCNVLISTALVQYLHHGDKTEHNEGR
jgi:hypothetical protein